LHRVVLLDPSRDRWRVVDVDQRWVDHGDLTAALGLERAWKCGTPRWETDDRVVHLLVPGEGEPLPGDGWLRGPAEAGFDEATVRWLTATYDAWRTGRLAAAGQPWWTAAWSDEVTVWLDEVLPTAGLRRVAAPVPTKLWSLSAVLRVPVAAAEGQAGGVRHLWFKATCEGFRAEPSLTALVAGLAPELTPDVVAVDPGRAWMLLEELTGADAAPAHLAVGAAAGMAGLQLGADRADLLAAGVEERSLAGLVGELHRALHDSVLSNRFPAHRWAEWAEVEPWVVEQIEALDAIGLPTALSHGDLHLGNIAGDSTPVVFDWTDACLTHPYLDARHLANECSDEEHAAQVWTAWSQPWRAAYPDVDHDRAWSLTPAVETAFQVATYERIFRAQDPDSRADLAAVVPWLHDRLRAARDAALDGSADSGSGTSGG
jgi:hypothetical protein